MIKKLNLKDIETVKDILEVQLASYKVEADIIDFYDIPPLKDTIDTLKECDEIFYGYYVNNDLAGIISYKVIDEVLDIHRVAIHPRFFRMGIAGKMLSFLEGLETEVSKIEVCTGKENNPAVSLYLKNGYKKIKYIEVSKDFYITQFEKTI